MIITKEWLDLVKPVNGSWTKAQISALGLKYPLPKGWKDELIGTDITVENARVVANSKTKAASNRQRNILAKQSEILSLAKGLDADSIADVISLLRTEMINKRR